MFKSHKSHYPIYHGFIFLFRFTDKESVRWLDKLEKFDSPKSSTNTKYLNLMRDKRQITTLMKTVLQKCDAKCLIKADLLVDNLLNFLSSSSSCIRIKQWFGADIIEVLLKRVLNSTKYVKKFRIGEADVTNQWKVLLKTAFDLLKSDTVDGLSLQTTGEFLHKTIILSNVYSSTWEMVQRRFHIFEEVLGLDTLRQSSTDTKVCLSQETSF